MRPLGAAEVVAAWEAGRSGSATAAALTLLEMVSPREAELDLVHLPLGDRDRMLLELRRRTLGPRLESATRCDRCGEKIEVSLRTDEVVLEPREEPTHEISFERDGFAARLRLPTSEDLLAIEDCGSVEAARGALLDRLVLDARRDGSAVPPADLTADEVAAVEEALERADPQAEVTLEVVCPECGHRRLAQLDVARFFVEELDVHAGRLLAEVHLLARAYGWRESEILALSAARRRRYLEMVGA